jgi:hypothetical protein
MKKTLNQLATYHGTDKSSLAHDYVSRYEIYLESYRETEFNFLEIGIYNGASLKTWRDYFPKAKVLGLDIDESCKVYEDGERVKVRIGDQTDREFLRSVEKEAGVFHVIVDDGGHTWKQQIVSFETLFPLLSPGGLYFVEDMHTSYADKWKDYEISGVEYFKSLVDSVNIKGKSFVGYTELGNQPLDYYENNIDFIHFYKSLIVIAKKQNPIC